MAPPHPAGPLRPPPTGGFVQDARLRTGPRGVSSGAVGNPSLAIIFPGQGSQTPGMRDVVAAERPDLIAEATRLVGADPFEHIDDGTRFAQPAIFCASIAHWERLGRPSADLFAGHSLGELAALAASGAISVEDGLRAVPRAAALMQEAAEANGGGRMLACRATREEAQVSPSAPASPSPTSTRRGRSCSPGTRRTSRAPPPCSRRPASAPRSLRFAAPSTRPPWPPRPRSSAGSSPVSRSDPAGARCSAAPPRRRSRTSAPSSPRRSRCPSTGWRCSERLYEDGVRRFLEPGPGKVLTGLVRRSLDGVEAEAAAELEPAGA